MRIIVGVASFGMSGKIFHAPLLTFHEKYHLKRIIQRSGNDAQSLYPETLVSRSIEDLLRDEELGLIVVNTPDSTHYELTKKCLERGKHVVVEKPMTMTVAEAEDLIALAQRKNKVLTVFQNRRWDGDFLTVQKVLRDGSLGRLVEFESHYDRYRNYIQPGTWKEKSADGAGILYNLGSHMIDQALVLFGMPEAVTAHLRIVRTAGEVDDWYDVRLHYNALSVLLRASYLVKEHGPRYILHGTHGSFIKFGLDPQEEDLKAGRDPRIPGWGIQGKEWWGMLSIEKDGKTMKHTVETLPGNYSAFYDNVYSSIVEGDKPAVPPEEGANVIRVIEAARRSNRERKTIELPQNRG
jgi:scyllo-inositol 2-dehydrogenase (NADP+)